MTDESKGAGARRGGEDQEGRMGAQRTGCIECAQVKSIVLV